MEQSLQVDFHGNIFVVERQLVLQIGRFLTKLAAIF